MGVVSSHLELSASHSYSQTVTSRSYLEINGTVQDDDALLTPESTRGTLVTISNQARDLAIRAGISSTPPEPRQSPEVDVAPVAQANDSTATDDPGLQLLIALIEYLTGKPVNLMDARDLQKIARTGGADEAPPPSTSAFKSADSVQPFSLYYEHTHRVEEHESANFHARGVIQTSDGKQITFAIELTMARSYVEETRFELQIGAARKREDPLVINFSGTSAQLQDQRFAFDLKADGNTVDIPLLAQGSGYLVFDRNGDHIVNDGSELFGALSGDAYADLAALDSDGNGWIDENDDAFKHLSLWLPEAEGSGKLISLEDAGVAAISTANIATPFELRGHDNNDLGAVRATGLYLSTANTVGTTQQIDLSV